MRGFVSVVTGGGLDSAKARWVSTSKRFLFPVRALATCFRAKVLHRLRALRNVGELVFDGACADLADDVAFRRLCDRLFSKNWVVYAKRPFGGPEQVFEYLGRYTHRVALSNARLVHVDDEQVRFRTRDGNHASLSPARFIGRYLLQILPRAFVKIRHYGLMASSNATTRLETARAQLLAKAAPPSSPPVPAAPRPLASLDWRAQLALLTGLDVSLCARCGGARVRHGLGALSLISEPTPRALDTS
jgi:hypothetical protein